MRTASNYVPDDAYPPATVPLYVYRDLAAELQAAQAHIQQLGQQNQQLLQENQVLRREIDHVVQAVMGLQNLTAKSQVYQYSPNPHMGNQVQQGVRRPVTTRRPVARKQPPTRGNPNQVKRKPAYTPPPVYIEEQEVSYYNELDAERSAMNSWWLLLAIAFIIFTAFGAGYLVVKPFIDSQTQ